MSPSTDGEGTSARERILAAAETLFAERGFDRTSTSALAAAAQVPQGLIFYHFRTKEELLRSLVEERTASELQDLLPDEPAASLAAAVELAWTTVRREFGTPKPMRRIVLREMLSRPDMRRAAHAAQTAITEQTARYLTRSAGRSGETPPAFRTVARLLVVAASLCETTSDPPPPELEPGAVATALTRGLSEPD